MPLVGWAALATSLPTVATFHADPPRWARTLYRRVPWVERALRSTSITAVSEVAASALPTRWGEAVVVPNAIDVDAYDIPIERNPRQVAFLGRDEPRKGLDHLLRAWPRIVEAVPDARLVVMGAKRSQPLPGVTFLGSVAAPVKNETLASSGVFVAPNTSGESFGIVVAEAMAAGCAIVASDLPGFAAVLGTAGRLVSPGDPAGIASAVVSLLGQPDLARALGERARTEVRRFDWPVVLGAYRQLYAAVRGI
jgi:phosphatidylinositol alpha-mannosyltransferase